MAVYQLYKKNEDGTKELVQLPQSAIDGLDLSNYVTTGTTQTISGTKTFTSTTNQMYGLRLKNATAYGSKLNFGDGDYVYIDEPTDDTMRIHAKTLTLDGLATGGLVVGGSAGTSGQVLTSKGTGSSPTWETPTSGGGGVVSSVNGSTTSGQSIYAPTTAGTNGQILVAIGIGAPGWAARSVGSVNGMRSYPYDIYAPITAGTSGYKLRSRGQNTPPEWVQDYAPTTAGTSGQVLMSAGSGAPFWSDAFEQMSSNAFSGNGGIKYKSSLIINWGSVTPAKAGTSITFSKSFSSSSSYHIVGSAINSTTKNQIYSLKTNNHSSIGCTAFGMYSQSNSGLTGSDVTFDWIAIGY